MGGERIHRHAEQPSLAAHGAEEGFIGWPHAGKTTVLDGHPFLGAGIAHHGHAERGFRKCVRFDYWSLGIGLE